MRAAFRVLSMAGKVQMTTSEEVRKAFNCLGFEVQVQALDKPNDFLVTCNEEDLLEIVEKLHLMRSTINSYTSDQA